MEHGGALCFEWKVGGYRCSSPLHRAVVVYLPKLSVRACVFLHGSRVKNTLQSKHFIEQLHVKAPLLSRKDTTTLRRCLLRRLLLPHRIQGIGALLRDKLPKALQASPFLHYVRLLLRYTRDRDGGAVPARRRPSRVVRYSEPRFIDGFLSPLFVDWWMLRSNSRKRQYVSQEEPSYAGQYWTCLVNGDGISGPHIPELGL